MIVLDTNIAIYYFKGFPDIVDFLDRQRRDKQVVAISSVTVIELLGYPDITPVEMLRVKQWLNDVLVHAVDLSIAEEAARIRREHRIKTVDSAIAATAVILKADLVTRDLTLQHIRDINVIAP